MIKIPKPTLKLSVGVALTLTLGIMLLILLVGLILPRNALLKPSGNDAKDTVQTVGQASGDKQNLQPVVGSPSGGAAPQSAAPTASGTPSSTSTAPKPSSPPVTTPGSTTTSVAPVLSFSASPSSITSGGTSTLSWSVQAAATQPVTCTAGGAWSGAKNASGSAGVSPSSTANYTLTCTNSAGSSGTKTVSVNVSPPVSSCSPGGTCSASDIASHNTSSNCWVGVTGSGHNKVYNITSSFNSAHISAVGKSAASSSTTCGRVISISTLKGYAGSHSSGSTIGGNNFDTWLASFYYANYQ